MMRVSKVLGSFVAVGAALVALATTTESQANADAALVNLSCSGGTVTVTAKAPWKTNDKAPWKWDKGAKVSVDESAAKFKGDKCEGTLKAYICNADQCKGPILLPVK